VIAAWIVCASIAVRACQGGMDRVIELVGRGEYGAALAVARAETDPLARAQGKLYVRHFAGDLDGALRAGAEGLASAPLDPWLNERMAYIELSLRRPAAALASIDALERGVSGRAEPERARWMDVVRERRAEAEGLALKLERRRRSLDVARATSVVVLGCAACGIAFLALARPKQKPP
jgi:hypothetical protein